MTEEVTNKEGQMGQIPLIIEEDIPFRPFSPDIKPATNEQLLESLRDSIRTGPGSLRTYKDRRELQKLGSVDEEIGLITQVSFKGIKGEIKSVVDFDTLFWRGDHLSEIATPFGNVNFAITYEKGKAQIKEVPLSLQMTFYPKDEEELRTLQNQKITITCGKNQFEGDLGRYSAFRDGEIIKEDTFVPKGKNLSEAILLPFNPEIIAKGIEMKFSEDREFVEKSKLKEQEKSEVNSKFTEKPTSKA